MRLIITIKLKEVNLGLFSTLIGGAIETAFIPLDVVGDVLTGGDRGYTGRKIDKLAKRVDDAVEDVSSLDLL